MPMDTSASTCAGVPPNPARESRWRAAAASNRFAGSGRKNFREVKHYKRRKRWLA